MTDVNLLVRWWTQIFEQNDKRASQGVLAGEEQHLECCAQYSATAQPAPLTTDWHIWCCWREQHLMIDQPCYQWLPTNTTTTYHQYTSQSLSHYCYTDINPTCALNINPIILGLDSAHRIGFCVFYVNAGIYSISILYASIYVENAESNSAGRIQLDSAFST